MMRTILLAGLASLVVVLPLAAGEPCPAPAEDCLNRMAAELPKRGLIGVDGEWDEGLGGFRVETFSEGTRAREAGLKEGDLLLAINGVALTDKEAYWNDRMNRVPGKTVSVTILRDGEKRELRITLMPMTESMIAEEVGKHMLKGHAKTEVAKAE